MTKLPRLYVNDKFDRLVNAVSASITQNLTPLSTATITLPRGEGLPARSCVEMFTPYGSAGFYRVRSPHDSYGISSTTADLEHMIAEVGDYVVKEEKSEMMSAKKAMQRAFSHYKGSHWALGSVTALGDDKIAYEAKYDKVLDVMMAILEQKPDCMLKFDFSTSPKWTVKVVKKGTTVAAEGRLARNVTSATVTYDDSELVTRAWYQTYPEKNGTVTPTWKKKDADTLKKYGVVESTVRTSSDMEQTEIDYTVNTFLAEHKEPRVSVSIEAMELCQITGESLDKVEVGRLYRLAIPDYNVTVEQNITSITWNDVYNSPRSISVNLGAEEDTVVTFLHNLDATGSGGGGGSGGKAKQKEEAAWSEYTSDWDVQNNYIAGVVTRQNRQRKILEQAGIVITSEGVETYAMKGKLTSKITQNAESISLVVEGTGKNKKIKSAEIVASINKQGKSEVRISADRVNLDGYVTAKRFESEVAKIDKLVSGQTTAIKICAIAAELGLPWGGSVKINGYTVSYKTITINGTTYHLLGHS